MRRLKTSVPKFGNWDKSEDVSFSSIFDNVRAEKGTVLHLPERNAKNILREQIFYENSSIEAGKRTPYGFHSGKSRENRQSFLPVAHQVEGYTDVNILQNPETAAGRGLSCVSDTQSQGLSSRYLGYNQPKSPSSVRVLPEPCNQFDAPAFNSRLPSGTASRHPLQSGATKETVLLDARPHAIQNDVQHQERLHAKSINTPRNLMHEDDLVITKKRSNRRGSEASRTAANMRRKHAVPRFGDWESGERFSAMFNKVRLEKRSKYSHDSIVKPVAPLRQPEEDLYKTSITSDSPIMPKKQSRWMRLMCCVG